MSFVLSQETSDSSVQNTPMPIPSHDLIIRCGAGSVAMVVGIEVRSSYQAQLVRVCSLGAFGVVIFCFGGGQQIPDCPSGVVCRALSGNLGRKKTHRSGLKLKKVKGPLFSSKEHRSDRRHGGHTRRCIQAKCYFRSEERCPAVLWKLKPRNRLGWGRT